MLMWNLLKNKSPYPLASKYNVRLQALYQDDEENDIQYHQVKTKNKRRSFLEIIQQNVGVPKSYKLPN